MHESSLPAGDRRDEAERARPAQRSGFDSALVCGISCCRVEGRDSPPVVPEHTGRGPT